MISSVAARLSNPVTYSRGLHLALPLAVVAVWLFIDRNHWYVPALLAVPVGLIPATRTAEGLQAQLFLGRHEHDSITAARSADRSDRWRTVLWLEVRLGLSAILLATCVPAVLLVRDLVRATAGRPPAHDAIARIPHPHWWYALLVPPIVVLVGGIIVGLGDLVTAAARTLLAPSAAQRLRALEESAEQLLEHNRIARELHDSIGHALTAAVLQAAAARATGDAEFTERALTAIEDTGRAALEDLDRVLLVLREPHRPTRERPALTDAERLFEAARSAGAAVDATVVGPLQLVPGPISREGYRILQEAVTNAMRHAGRVPITVRVRAEPDRLDLDVANELIGPVSAGPGTGLRGIRERAELLGGKARFGVDGDNWRVRVELPIQVRGVTG
ncbi:sensor histidine kinase [Nocardia stercoris]|uniref:histidine kinase n=1 Tax=Nocardia stercoris TaxID=2483361 RepID=A0A3M2L2M1_9NOCA|nr:histidine kinase [Nocardia stercoris]RMI31196.1 two-component sensor histidine kinase [Nocardia stercoris]